MLPAQRSEFSENVNMYAKFVGRRWLCATTVAVLALAGWNAATFAQEKKPEPPKPKDIVDVARQAADLKTFSMLLEKSGLVETLKEKGPYTVLAPTDEAFNRLGKEKLENLQKPENKATLQRILKNHILSGRKTVAELEQDGFVKTMAGDYVTVSAKDGVVMVDHAKVTKPDVEAGNGLIDMVDTVLVPAEKPEKQP
jgi:uncharacterized surface protein with fasciclin (FAS1) repeats